MANYDEYLEQEKSRLLKAIKHLEYSYNKVQTLSEYTEQLDEVSMEIWESFAARFDRVADMFMMRYLRACVLQQDVGFVGSFRDFLNQAEKINLIEDAETWMAIRGLRNIAAHEYTDKDLAEFFKRLKKEAPLLLSLRAVLDPS